MNTGKIILYKNKIEVNLIKETVWLSQAQMAVLFDTERSVITKHLRNIFNSKELSQNSVCAKIAHTAGDKKIYQTNFYNLDAIISVAYRVNSKKGTQFRIWATKVLKQHLVEGYTLNEKRLKKEAEKYIELKKAVNILGNLAQIENISDEAKGLTRIIAEYSKALELLDKFDHQTLTKPKGKKRTKYTITYNKAIEVIEAMKKKFKDSNLVGQEKDASFQSSLGAIYQTAGGKELYPTIEEKAAHLLYFVTKNHSFVDGNKRIAAALFIFFLEKNMIQSIDQNTLVALTIMIASSRPSEKDTMIKVILNLLQK